ncbi:PEP-CTERM sorting domain-containing protein [Kiritimatiellota bacterium B12222]|nr:PEP-CTERM sorting domain-containing protein [Kiritimatiellota bacterium B12222]
MKKKLVYTLLFIGFAAICLQAELIASDDFNSYSIGELNSKGTISSGWQSTWSAATGSNVVNGGLSYSGGDISINGGSQALSITGSNNYQLNRQFDTFGTSSGEDAIYFSFLFRQVSGTPADFLNFTLDKDQDYELGSGIGDLSGTQAEFSARVKYTVQASETVSYTSSETYLLVGRVSRDGDDGDRTHPLRFDQIELWVNPTSSSLGTADVIFDSSSGMNDISYFGLRSANIGSGDEYLIDELRIGTDFSSIVIPEPSSLLLLGIGLVLARMGVARRITTRS